MDANDYFDWHKQNRERLQQPPPQEHREHWDAFARDCAFAAAREVNHLFNLPSRSVILTRFTHHFNLRTHWGRKRNSNGGCLRGWDVPVPFVNIWMPRHALLPGVPPPPFCLEYAAIHHDPSIGSFRGTTEQDLAAVIAHEVAHAAQQFLVASLDLKHGTTTGGEDLLAILWEEGADVLAGEYDYELEWQQQGRNRASKPLAPHGYLWRTLYRHLRVHAFERMVCKEAAE